MTDEAYQAALSEAAKQIGAPKNQGSRLDRLADQAMREWPEPQPLTAKIEPEAYPIDALPDAIRDAVTEVQQFTQAPLPMVASSALGALSLAIQAHVDVQRADRLTGPVSLFLLTIADSGERKSTCDGYFAAAIREYEREQAEAAKPATRKYAADLETWEARRNGLKDKIRRLARDGKPTDEQAEKLREIERSKPEAPLVPRLMYSDATPEQQAYSLAKCWPSGGVVSAEGGAVFGAHGMGKDSVMRNLALLNQLWDGATLTIDRRTSESYRVEGARLSMAIQVQEATLREFFDRAGPLARGSGFLARFLIAWPISTQGRRPFRDPPESWPALAAFNRRITGILNDPVPMSDDGRLEPRQLVLDPQAKAAWVEYHDTIEAELRSGGELYDVRDVASKSADNAARLAALFQIFNGAVGAVGLESFEAASRIAAWHLHESRRFFGELALPPEQADAARLDAWLMDQGITSIPRRDCQRLGPVRDGARLDVAISELEDLDRVRLREDGKRITIELNPALGGVA